MKKKVLNIFIAFSVSVLLMVLLCQCRKTDFSQKDNGSYNDTIIADIAAAISDDLFNIQESEQYKETQSLFYDYIKHVYAYEINYFLKINEYDDENKAFEDAVKLKTKVLYALNNGCVLTQEEIETIEKNEEKNLEMLCFTSGISENFDPEEVTEKLFGLTYRQYQFIRLCRSFAEKYVTVIADEMISGNKIDINEVKDYYESNKDEYSYVVLRYISYVLQDEEAQNLNIIKEAESLCSNLNTIEDMLTIIGNEGDLQSAGNTNGQITVKMNQTDSIFYQFLHENGTNLNAKTVVKDEHNIYVAMCEGYFTWDNSDIVKETSESDFALKIIEEKMLKNILLYEKK